mgnify:CR=1 FL=1
MDIKTYHSLLAEKIPEFLKKYLELPCLTRLKGVGLLCGTDWTSLYRNKFFYSRYDHSLGCALIAWNFTKSKTQCLASLFHDLSTPVFSHVGDFRRGDTLKQEATENKNKEMILTDALLNELLREDKILAEEVCDYHVYPICDNEIPCLSSDRLEYMYPSGMALRENKNCDDNLFFDEESVQKTYKAVQVLKNEHGIDELGFTSLKEAEDYTRKFCATAILLQHNENKLALSMLGTIMNYAMELKILSESECFTLSEAQVIEKFDSFAKKNPSQRISSLIRTWRNMTEIKRFKNEQGPEWYSVNIQVKKRYINPLVKLDDGSIQRVSKVSFEASKIIDEFLRYNDAPFGAVKLV